jgi:hypothetical protein
MLEHLFSICIYVEQIDPALNRHERKDIKMANIIIMKKSMLDVHWSVNSDLVSG